MPPTSHARGIALYLAGVALFAANDALGKWLVTDYSVAELMLIRSAGAGLLLLFLARGMGVSLRLPAGQAPLHILRILLLAGDSFSFYFATKALPLADVMTFYMSAPLIITAASALLLKERVGLKRWSAILIGFGGVVIALQPTSAAFQPAALVALFGAACFALALVITRRLRDYHWLSLVAWQFIGCGIVGAAASPFDWVTPSWLDFSLMALVGLVASGCFMLITKALSLAPASLLAPLQYTAIVWASILGWMFWRDEPTPHIILGNAIIIGSGLFVLSRERRLKVDVNARIEPIP
ncbi:DMT family transporter [Dongia sp.]|uniref:DMT family transporter n=1 Tax=Dongia sp. TaxID=1977262 RepID=UPI0035B1E23D